jgi:hypothetical protein
MSVIGRNFWLYGTCSHCEDVLNLVGRIEEKSSNFNDDIANYSICYLFYAVVFLFDTFVAVTHYFTSKFQSTGTV